MQWQKGKAPFEMFLIKIAQMHDEKSFLRPKRDNTQDKMDFILGDWIVDLARWGGKGTGGQVV